MRTTLSELLKFELEKNKALILLFEELEEENKELKEEIEELKLENEELTALSREAGYYPLFYPGEFLP